MFVSGQDPPSMKLDKPDKFYGVAVGRKPGVYTDWSKAQAAIKGWKGPKYRKFETRAEAEAFVRSFNNPAQEPLDEIEDLLQDPDEEEEEDDVEVVEQPPAKRAKTAPTVTSVPVIYTDGSSLGNGRSGASAGVGVFFGVGDPRYAIPAHSPLLFAWKQQRELNPNHRSCA
jgi:ribonuclease HI